MKLIDLTELQYELILSSWNAAGPQPIHNLSWVIFSHLNQQSLPTMVTGLKHG